MKEVFQESLDDEKNYIHYKSVMQVLTISFLEVNGLSGRYQKYIEEFGKRTK